MSRTDATKNDTAAAATTDSVTPKYMLLGVCAHTARIEPGAAGARRPVSKSMLMAIPVMPPRIVAAISLGLASTYGK